MSKDDSSQKDGLQVIAFGTTRVLETWLSKHGDRSPGIWIKIAKKASGIKTVTYAEALDCALCYGWIDGQKASFDADYFLQRFTPRRTKSKWSKINCQHVERLTAAKRMQPAGLKQVELAKADGRWDAAYDGQRNAQVPEDLAAALTKNKKAQKFFDGLSPVNRYAILYRIQDAKKPETRIRRIEKFVSMLSAGETLH